MTSEFLTPVTTTQTDAEAWALAELVKRISWDELRGNAANENEAYAMRDAVNRLQGALAEAGFNPR